MGERGKGRGTVLRIGIIGMRGMGGIRARAAAKRNDCAVTCIAGRDEELLKAKSEEIGCDYVLDAEQLIHRSDVEGVVVATPNSSHFPLGLATIEAGKHVFIEYPPAVSLEELDGLIAAAGSRGVTFGVGLSDRFEGPHLYLKHNSDKVGRPVLAQGCVALGYIWKWAARNESMGDFFSFANFHHIDQFIDLFGPVEWVSGTLTEEQDDRGNNTLLAGTTQMGFRNGVVGWSQYLMGVPGPRQWVTTISGSEGSLVSDSGRITWSHRDAAGEVSHEEIDPESIKEDPPPMDADFGLFVDAAVKNEPCPLSGELSRHSCEVAFASTESARTGRRVAISPH